MAPHPDLHACRRPGAGPISGDDLVGMAVAIRQTGSGWSRSAITCRSPGRALPPLGVAKPVQLHGPRRTLIRSICAVAARTLMHEMRTCGGQPVRLEGPGGALAWVPIKKPASPYPGLNRSFAPPWPSGCRSPGRRLVPRQQRSPPGLSDLGALSWGGRSRTNCRCPHQSSQRWPALGRRGNGSAPSLT